MVKLTFGFIGCLLGAAGMVTGVLGASPAYAVPAAPGLGSGQTLPAGAKLSSPDGQYSVIMQDDGNLVDYASPRPLWATGTINHPGSDLEMQADGNLVLYGPGHVPLWASNTAGHPGASLQLQDDANMVVLAADGSVLWAAGGVDSRLDAGQSLLPGWQIQSPDRRYRMVMQADGNLVAYQGATAVWSTRTSEPGSDLEMQADGNLVVYAPGHIAVWASGTSRPNSALLGQDDGNFVIYAPGNTPTWATSTSTVTSAVPAATPPTLASCPTMRQGSAGPCVLMLQQYLNGAPVSPTVALDGVYGSLTRQAVMDYQVSRGLTADGTAGPQTLQALTAHQPAASPPAPVRHNYPASFDPQAAAAWAVANALAPLPVPSPVPDSWKKLVDIINNDVEPCTTFASWALAKGGMPEEPDWFPYWDSPSTQHSVFLYMTSDTPVPAWYAADSFVSRFTSLGWASERQIYPGSIPTAISVGDIIYYQWDGTPNHPHLAVVTRIVNGQIQVTDQGGATLYPGSINRPMLEDHNRNDLTVANPHMKVFVLHWQ